MRTFVAARRFDPVDQHDFASLSGDVNPMHVDPVAARRTPAGECVVHGVHAVLWALDRLVAARFVKAPIATLDAKFQKFIYVGAEVTLDVVRDTEESLRAEIVADGTTTTVLTIAYGEPNAGGRPLPWMDDLAVNAAPLVVELSAAKACKGRLSPVGDSETLRAFPHAARWIGVRTAGAVVRLSTIVGMMCPGLHSIFGAFKIALTAVPDTPGIAYETATVDERFRMVEIMVGGDGIAGSLTAFFRPAPVAQRSMRQLVSLINMNEFASATALVVGGSRGLGALTARAIAAGGGRVILTYAVGEAEAREVADDIGPAACRVRQFDARRDAAMQLAGLDWDVDQLYYFATPQIFRQRPGWYAASRFADFCRIYVDGFADVCSALRARAARDVSAFYPSSVFVEERPRDMTEYAMAKAAGEVLCADMNRFAHGLRVVMKRLPRVATDQTASIMPTEIGDPWETMLPILREMQADPGEDTLMQP